MNEPTMIIRTNRLAAIIPIKHVGPHVLFAAENIIKNNLIY